MQNIRHLVTSGKLYIRIDGKVVRAVRSSFKSVRDPTYPFNENMLPKPTPKPTPKPLPKPPVVVVVVSTSSVRLVSSIQPSSTFIEPMSSSRVPTGVMTTEGSTTTTTVMTTIGVATSPTLPAPVEKGTTPPRTTIATIPQITSVIQKKDVRVPVTSIVDTTRLLTPPTTTTTAPYLVVVQSSKSQVTPIASIPSFKPTTSADTSRDDTTATTQLVAAFVTKVATITTSFPSVTSVERDVIAVASSVPPTSSLFSSRGDVFKPVQSTRLHVPVTTDVVATTTLLAATAATTKTTKTSQITSEKITSTAPTKTTQTTTATITSTITTKDHIPVQPGTTSVVAVKKLTPRPSTIVDERHLSTTVTEGRPPPVVVVVVDDGAVVQQPITTTTTTSPPVRKTTLSEIDVQITKAVDHLPSDRVVTSVTTLKPTTVAEADRPKPTSVQAVVPIASVGGRSSIVEQRERTSKVSVEDRTTFVAVPERSPSTVQLQPVVVLSTKSEHKMSSTEILQPDVVSSRTLEPKVTSRGKHQPEIITTTKLKLQIVSSTIREPKIISSEKLKPSSSANFAAAITSTKQLQQQHSSTLQPTQPSTYKLQETSKQTTADKQTSPPPPPLLVTTSQVRPSTRTPMRGDSTRSGRRRTTQLHKLTVESSTPPPVLSVAKSTVQLQIPQQTTSRTFKEEITSSPAVVATAESEVKVVVIQQSFNDDGASGGRGRGRGKGSHGCKLVANNFGLLIIFSLLGYLFILC